MAHLHLVADLLEDGPPLSTKEVRKLTILQELPFVVSFADRVKVIVIIKNGVINNGGHLIYIICVHFYPIEAVIY